MKAEVTIFGLEEMDQRLKKLEDAIASLTKQPPERTWFDVQGASQYLGISPSSLRRLIARGLIKKCVGIRHVRVHREELEKYYRQRTTI